MLRHGMPVPPELSGVAPARLKTLVVAEPGAVREGVARQLAAQGYAVEQSSPGFAAGAAAARYEPDVIVLAAPSRDGGDTLPAIRADRELAEVPVVAVGLSAWKDDLRAAGAAAVASPSVDGAIAGAVEEALRGASPRPGARSRPARGGPGSARPRRGGAGD